MAPAPGATVVCRWGATTLARLFTALTMPDCTRPKGKVVLGAATDWATAAFDAPFDKEAFISWFGESDTDEEGPGTFVWPEMKHSQSATAGTARTVPRLATRSARRQSSFDGVKVRDFLLRLWPAGNVGWLTGVSNSPVMALLAFRCAQHPA